MNGWRLAWRLARRELSVRFRGLRLLLVCLVLGVGALAAIGSLSGAISGELGARGQVLLGGDVEFSVSQRRAEPAELAAMQRIGRVSETVRMQSMAVTLDGNTAPVQLKAIDRAYPLYGRLTLADDRSVRAPPADAAWISPALAERLRVRGGDTLRLGTARFRIGGIIADEPDRLSEGFTLGPVVLVSAGGLARTGLVQPGSLYETKYRVALAGDPGVAARGFERGFATAGWETRTRDRASPGASRFITRMGEFLTLVGLAALVIAGIGVGNGVSSYLEARRSSIAMLKVLGATSALVTRVYLLQVLAVSAVGIALGLLVGFAAVPLIGRAAGAVLPVAPGFSVQPLPLALAAGYGLLIALAFCAPALLAAGSVPAAALLRGALDPRRRVTRRAVAWMAAAALAILALALVSSEQPWFAAGFLGAAAATLLLLVALGTGIRVAAARLPRPRRPLPRLALTALHRPGARTVPLVVALGLGLTVFVLLATIRTSLDGNIRRSVPERAPALFALDVPPEGERDFRRTVAAAAPGARVATVPLMRGTITAYGGTRVADLPSIPEGAWALRGERGLTFAAALPPGSDLVQGRWWTPAEGRRRRLVSVDERLAESLNLRIGDPLTVSVLGLERTATIASFRRIAWDTLGFNFVLVFSPGALADVPHNLAATIDMPAARVPAVTRALLPRFPSTSVIEVGGVLAQVQAVVGQMATAIAAAAGVAVLAGIAVLVGAIAAARAARTYDATILKVLGATRAQVLALQAIEHALLAAVMALVALVLGTAGGWYVVTQLFGFDWLPDWRVICATLAMGALVTVGIGLIGSLPVLRARPASALRAL